MVRLESASARRVALLVLAAAFACVMPPTPKRLSVPPEMARSAPPAPPASSRSPAPAPAPKPEPRAPASDTRYMVRLAESGRVWEVELPESAGGYEIRVPLAGGPLEQLTQADEELLADSTARAATSGLPEALAPAAGTKPEAKVDARGAAKKKSYLGSLARVNELYLGKKYELALIEVVSLEKEYPEDARILAMKGSLYLKLRKPKLAREAWEKALAVNPNDQAVAEALREISAREE